MKKVTIILLLVISVFAFPANAQWYKNAAKGMRSQTRKFQQQTGQKIRTQANRWQQKIIQPAKVTPRQVERAVFQATQRKPSPTVLNASRALIPLRERHHWMRYFRVNGTAFAIEEIHNGKRYIWGVTATHYGYQTPAIPKKRFIFKRFLFEAQGNRHANDVSIFPIPESLANAFEPLKLASNSPEVGERLFSLSFFDDQFQYTPGRTVLKTSPTRFTTSLKIDPEIEREGECGSPLLNSDGEVVGMVVGASYTQGIGFAVPVENIRQILKAYHQHGDLFTPVLINGKEILQLNITEAITQVTVKNIDGSERILKTNRREMEVDYAHLETFMDMSQAKEITLTIERTPFTGTHAKSAKSSWEVVYNLQTQKISEYPID